MLFIFSTPVLVRHLQQLKTVIFLHWGLICAVQLEDRLAGQMITSPVEKANSTGMSPSQGVKRAEELTHLSKNTD